MTSRGLMVLRATRGGALARNGFRYHPYTRYASRAYAAYRYGRAALPYVRTGFQLSRNLIRASSKRRQNYVQKRRVMRRIGERVGSSTSKWNLISQNLIAFNPETLQQVRLLEVAKGAGGSAYDTRQTDMLNFRGIKFCMNFRVEGAIGTAKAWLSVAVISPKSDLASNQSIPNAGFFRDPQGSTRSRDFGNVLMTNLDYKCSAINSDKYNIHKHARYIIGPAQSTEGHKERYIEWYMPLKRQIRYESNTSNPEGKNMYLVWWYSTSDGGTPNGAVQVQHTVKRYFREPRQT